MKKGRRILLAYIKESSGSVSEQICIEIETARMFDEIIPCTDKDISDCDTQSGYHSKKVNALLDIMNKMDDDDILVYSQVSIPTKKELKKWLNIISKNSAIFFYHADTMDGISEFLIRDFYYKTKILPFCRLNGELFLLRKESQYLIEEWRDRIEYSQKDNGKPSTSEYAILNNTIYNHLDDNKIILSIPKI